MMTDEQLRAIAALCDAATPGSWKSGWSWQDAINGGKSAWSEGPVHVGDTLSQVAPQAIADAAFIAAARQDVPALLAEIADLRRQLHARIVAADRAVADARRERDDLRRQLTEAQAEIAAVRRLESELYGMRTQLGDSRDLRAQLESDNIELRRQLAEMQEEIEKFEVLGIAAGAENPSSPESILTAILHMTPGRPAKGRHMTIDEALAHIGAYIEGGDELGVIGEDEAGEAYNVICAEADALRRQLAEAKAEIDAFLAIREAANKAIAEAADLRRQLAEVATRVNAADRAVAVARRERDAAKSTAADLRRQLAQALGELDICRLSLAASEQARIKAEEMANVLRIRLSLDKPPPPPTCGHRGMAGSAGCALPAGHPGEHEYRSFAER